MEFTLAEDAVGLNPVRAMGHPLNILPIVLDFSSVTDYSTGGEEIDLSNYFNYEEHIMILIPVTDGYLFEYDPDNEKVIVYEGDGTDGIAEVANEGDISSIGEIRAFAFGY